MIAAASPGHHPLCGAVAGMLPLMVKFPPFSSVKLAGVATPGVVAATV